MGNCLKVYYNYLFQHSLFFDSKSLLIKKKNNEKQEPLKIMKNEEVLEGKSNR